MENGGEQLDNYIQLDNLQIKDKENKYAIIDTNLNKFFEKYNYAMLSLISKFATISSALKKEFSEFTFVGFYIVTEKSSLNGSSFNLEIGPYVSSILATPIIEFGKGVCGTSWEKNETIIVNNVRNCNNYIACSIDVMSEIVVPVFNKDSEVIAVLDIDCNILDRFDIIDKNNLENLIKKYIN